MTTLLVAGGCCAKRPVDLEGDGGRTFRSAPPHPRTVVTPSAMRTPIAYSVGYSLVL